MKYKQYRTQATLMMHIFDIVSDIKCCKRNAIRIDSERIIFFALDMSNLINPVQSNFFSLLSLFFYSYAVSIHTFG